MIGLVLCIKLNSFVAHMLYAWSLSHYIEVPTAINLILCLLWDQVIKIKIEHSDKHHLYDRKHK